MIALHNPASMRAVLDARLEPELRNLLTERIQDAAESDVLNMTTFLVVEPGDREQDIVDEIGLSPLVNPIDGARYGAATFHPYWDLLCDRGAYFEMIICVGSSGFAYDLILSASDEMQQELVALCREYAE